MDLMTFLIPAAHAQDAAGAASDGAGGFIMSILPLLLIFVVFWFLLIRPQQKRMKEHAAKVGAAKRGDTVVTTGGLVGKVNKVFDDEVSLEVGENVRVRVIKSMIIEVRGKAEPVAAND